MRKLYYKILTNSIAKFLRVPQFLILYLTNDCWMKCRHCFYDEKFRKSNDISNSNLTFDELKKLSESISKLLYISFAGGEPFIREDIEEIIKLFTKNKKVYRYQIPTSGLKTDLVLEKTIRILDKNPSIPFRVHVSIDGSKDIHNKIRGLKSSFDNAVETIIQLNKLKKIYPHFDTGIITTICSYNQHNMAELGELVREIHPGGEWCINIVRGEPRNPKAIDVDRENYFEAVDIIDKKISDGIYKGYTGHYTSGWLSAKNAARRKIIGKILENKYKGGGCSAGSLGGVIYPDGSVFACEMLKEQIGNLRDYGYNLPVLWNSINAKKLRGRIQETECVCTHECSLSTNFLIQPRTWPSLISERFKLLIHNKTDHLYN